MVQLRDHEIEEELFSEAAFDLVDRIRSVSRHVLISINTRIRIASMFSAEDGPVAGVHVGKRGPSVEEARRVLRAGTPVGISVHSIGQICSGEVDYFLWSPVFPTKSKPGHKGTGIQNLAEAVKSAKHIAVIAMGGITAENTAKCLKTGAHGVAGLSGILAPEHIPHTVTRYQHKCCVSQGTRTEHGMPTRSVALGAGRSRVRNWSYTRRLFHHHGIIRRN